MYLVNSIWRRCHTEEVRLAKLMFSNPPIITEIKEVINQHKHKHTRTHTHTHWVLCDSHVHVWEHVVAYNHSTPQRGCFLRRAEEMSSYSLHTRSRRVPGHAVCLRHPSIWITKLVCALSIQSTVSLSGSLPFFSPSSSPFFLLHLLSHMQRHRWVSPDTFVFHCLPFGEVTHDTLWSLATPGEY